MTANDNDAEARLTASRSAEAHGHAALLLVESLIHGLIAKEALSSAESRDIVLAAADVQADYSAATDAAGSTMALSHELLARIARSLSADIAGPPALAALPRQPEGSEE